MAHKKLTDVYQLATGTGTGALTLGAAASPLKRTMQAAGMEDADTAYVMIRHATIPTEWQIVLVTYAASGTTITPSFDSRSKSPTGALISFSAGNKLVSEARHDGVDWIVDERTAPVNVVNFIDDASDVLAAFEDALAINGSIFIPAGHYRFSAALSFTARQISIIGETSGLVVLEFDDGGIELFVPTTPYGQYANIIVRHLSIIANSAGTSDGLTIGLDSAVTDTRITIDDIEFTGSDGVYGPTQSVTGTSHTSTLIDGIASTADILVGSTVTSGPGLAAGLTYVVSKTANSVTLNQATTSSTTDTFTFNAGALKYWANGIKLNSVWHASITNIRFNGGGAGKTENGIWLNTADDVVMFDYFISHCTTSQTTISLRADGWVEGLYVTNSNFYTTRDGFVAAHATSTVVGTFGFENAAFFASRNPFITNRIAGLQIENCFIVRGFNESAWNPPDSGVLSSASGFYYPGSLLDITGSDGDTNYDLHTITNNNFFSSGTSDNVILMTDVRGATIGHNAVWGGSFTNGLNFQGSSAQITFDNIVAAFTAITNPVVRGGSTGRIVAGTFILNSNYVTDFQQKTFESEAGATVPALAVTGDIDEAKWLFASAGSFSFALYNDRASQPAVAGLSTITYKSRTFSARAQMLSDGGLKQAAYLETQAVANAPGVAMTGDIDEAKWLTALGGYNLTFYNDRESQPDIDGSSTIAHGGRTYYARVMFGSDGGLRVAGDLVSENDVVAVGDVSATGHVLAGDYVYSGPSSGDARVGGQAASGSDRVRFEAVIPGVGIWYWGADGSGGGYKWKLAWDSNSFANPAITVDPTTKHLEIGSSIGGTEISAPAAPAANGWVMYGEDNGAGKTRLMVRFASGAAQQIAIEP